MLKEIITAANQPLKVASMLRLGFGANGPIRKEPFEHLAETLNDRDFCYEALNRVSRSFALVIQNLPLELKDPVCVFYLVLRGLDSVEDDLKYPTAQRIGLLRDFHKKSSDPNWNITGVGDSMDYRILLSNYHKVTRTFQSLDPRYQSVIADTCAKMGDGMANMSESRITSTEDYDRYCYYVAGLVGIGLSGIFGCSGFESTDLVDRWELANSMGTFLQKTNIIRDYFEDLNSERQFWPEVIWGAYGDNLVDFRSRPTSRSSLGCLNHLITDALRHVPHCLEYLSLIRDEDVFRFCAIPQTMAIATLSKLYENPAVFTGKVKISKAQAAWLMIETKGIGDINQQFSHFTEKIRTRLNSSDPNYRVTADHIDRILESV